MLRSVALRRNAVVAVALAEELVQLTLRVRELRAWSVLMCHMLSEPGRRG